MASHTEEMIKHLEDQGAEVRRTKKGLMIMAPGGGSVVVHHTPSDHRAQANAMAALRRVGLTHPDDKRRPKKKSRDEYPAYVTAGVSKERLEKARQILFDRGWPVEATSEDLAGLGDATTVGKALYHLGYRWHPDGKKRGRLIVWIAPDDIQRMHEDMQTRQVVENSHEPVQQEVEPYAPSEPEPEPEEEEEEGSDPEVTVANGREFIDTVDSWIVDTGGDGLERRPAVPAEVRAYLDGLRAAGLEVEIRVWRKK